MDDLVQEAYQKSILENFRNLGPMVAQTGTCEGAVRKKITWFLQTRQARGNPAARRIFNNLCLAIQRLIGQGVATRPDNGNDFRSRTIVLRTGAREPVSDQQLKDYFSDQLVSPAFARKLSVKNEESVQHWVTLLQDAFGRDLPGFYVGELSNLFSATLPREIGQSADSQDDSMDFLNSQADDRTPENSFRYSLLDDEIEELRSFVDRHFAGSPRRDRILKIIAVLLDVGQRVPIREIGERLGIPPSTINDDLNRLEAEYSAYKASKNEP
jgi:hypothetical protein